IAAQAERTPDALAVISGDASLSYAALNARANQLAHLLRAQGAGPEVPVALCLPRARDQIVALLAIWKAGAGYVPLDPAYPPARLQFLLADAGCPLLVTHAPLLAALPPFAGTIICLDRDQAQLDQQPTTNPAVVVPPAALAYVIYTSGSTGQPKGVPIPQQALLSYVRAAQEHYAITAADRVLQFATLTFDASVEEIVTSLTSGATLVLRSEELLATPETFFAGCRQEAISVLSLPTAFWHLLAEAVADGTLPVPESLRLVIIGGERALPARVAQWQARLGDRCQLINTYGPTETTVVATAYHVPASVDPALGDIPIGRSLANLRAYVLDAYGQPVPIGVRGELYFGGFGLARGYRNRPDLTAEKFIPDPFSGEAGARLYKTGDLARLRPDGQIAFVGRVDGQMKVRGFRIEPDEINAVLEQHPAVHESIVVGAHNPSGQASIVAYVVASQDAQPTLAELRTFLKQALPEYMLPSAFVFLPELPRTTSGKIDRRALPAPDRTQHIRDAALVAPRTPAEELVASVWSAVLGVPHVGAFDHFFELGGHSLLATQAVARLRKTFDLPIPLRFIFEAPVVADLAARLTSTPRTEQSLPNVPLRAYPRSEHLPLSFAQQRLWFLDQLDPGSASYHIPLVVRLHGTLDPDALAHSLTALVARHEALRTTIATIDDQPVQLIAPLHVEDIRVALPVMDLQAPSQDEIAAVIRAEVGQPFDLRQGPLLRARLLRLHRAPSGHGTRHGTRDEQILILTLHHIVTDGWSQSVLLRELTTLYQSYVQAAPVALPTLPIQYADYAVWQREYLQGAVLQQQIDYWRRQLADMEPIDLPTDYPRSTNSDQPGALHSFTIPAAIGEDMQRLSRQLGATLFMTLLAAWQVLLGRYSRQSDIAVGVPIAGRTRPELEGLIGMFVNTLVLRADLAGQPTFAELLSRVRAVCLDAYAHQDVPFELLVETLQPERDLSRTPLFQVMFTLQNTPRTTIDLPELTLEPVAVEVSTAKFDLSLVLSEQPSGLQGVVEYRSDLFAAATIARLVGHYQELLAALVADPHRRIDDLPMLTEAERRQLLIEWNADTLDLPAVGGIHELVEAQVARTPDAIAVRFGEQELTYAELNGRANQLASYLRERGVGPEVCVGIAMEPALELVVAVLGVFKTGGAYVPFDPAYPAERLHWLFSDSQVALVLTQKRLLERLPAVDVPALALDQAWQDIAAQPTCDPAVAVSPDQLAYMIYTSGSTGRPKGVMLAHRGVINNLMVHQASSRLSAGDRMLLNYSISFDPSVWSIFLPLISGAQLVLVPAEVRYDSAALVRAIAEQGISVFGVSPSQLAVLIEEPGIAACTALRYVVCGGENLSRELQARFFDRLPAVLCNAYGPTEATIDTTFWHCPRVDVPQGSVIGRPLANVQVYVLDRAMQPVPVGVPGELYVGGIGLARGYHRRPDLTAERFVPDPFGHAASSGTATQPNARLYKTGDLVRYRVDGALEFLGRIDNQVKVRGFRIELGEIEATLEQHEAVQSAVVMIREDRPGDRRIVAYVVPQENLEDSPEPGSWFSVLGSAALRQFLAERLPEYMVPSAFVLLDTLPLTPSDKLDRQALPAPDLQDEDVREIIAPRTPVEEVIAGVWASVLGRERISVDDNFFALGGHSLLATQVITRLRTALGLDLPLRLLFESPTIAGFAAHLAAQPPHAHLPLVPRSRNDRTPLSFAQQRLWFLDQLQPESALYTIPLVVRLSGPLSAHALRSSLTALVARHEGLRTTFAYDLTTEAPEPYQRIAPPSDVALPVVELPSTADETMIHAIVQREVERPFDVQNGPLLRALLIQQDPSTHLLVLVAHHIVTDGWSQSVLLRELTALYQGHVQGTPVALPALPIQYADYAVWQRDWLSGTVLQQQIDYWHQQLAGVEPIDLPTDRPRPGVASYRGAYQTFHLSAALSEDLRHLSQRLGATLFMTLLAAWQALLMRHSSQTDIAVGTPIAGRVRPELEGLIGMFVNTLVLRTDLAGQPTFAELVSRVRAVCLDAYAHQDIPFDVVVEQLQPTRDMSRHPFFQVMFMLQNTPRTTIELPELRVESVILESHTAKFDLSLALNEVPDGLQGAIEYATDLFDAETIARLADHFQQLLQAIVAAPHQRVTVLPILTAAERQQLLRWNQTALAVPDVGSIPQAFEAQAARTPEATALIVGTQRLTYHELNQRANQLAHALRERGIGPEVRVGVCLHRTADLVVALLAVLKAGGAYAPLDPAYPAERLQFMLDDAQAPLLLTQHALVDRVPAHNAAVLCLDTDWEPIASQPTHNPPWSNHALNLAYLIYTSGSTGRPKGVAITHHSAAVLLG
ncbi:MAG TPA: amino acid adenylation domain-containing protein, partial [Herpetosiphonaceae bacterium]